MPQIIRISYLSACDQPLLITSPKSHNVYFTQRFHQTANILQGWRLRRLRDPHVIFGVDTEVVLSSSHDVEGCELVVEEAVGYSLPHALDGVASGHYVIQPVVPLLVWGGSPGHSHCFRNILLQLHWAGRLGIIWNQVATHISGRYLRLDVGPPPQAQPRQDRASLPPGEGLPSPRALHYG
ncbi:hypothetical protein J4Q44_G00100230 [Coregonus suidteri]|uniref:Uncharacterized protein n=1 Tax=Coregonus suidteri TaxID=861788 RepID=A0AAN8M0G3_9TELE